MTTEHLRYYSIWWRPLFWIYKPVKINFTQEVDIRRLSNFKNGSSLFQGRSESAIWYGGNRTGGLEEPFLTGSKPTTLKSTWLQLQLSLWFLSPWFGPNPKPPMNCCKSSVVVNCAIGLLPGIPLAQNADFSLWHFSSVCTKPCEDILLDVSGEKVSLVITRRRIHTHMHTHSEISHPISQTAVGPQT